MRCRRAAPRYRAPAWLALILGLGPVSLWAATVVVNDASDDLHSPGCALHGTGTCSLRDAITFANSNPGADRIEFNIPGAGVRRILPTSALPNLADDAGVTIDGYTQPGASVNTLATGDDAVLLIEIDGSSIPSGGSGMLMTQSSNNAIRGLVLNRYIIGDCIALLDSNNVAEGNFLGTDSTGLMAKPCRGAVTVLIGSGNRIGGTNPASRNVMVAESLNVVDLFGLGSNVVQGNYVGTDRNGTNGLGSPFHGVAIDSDGNLIGGLTPGAGNLISGNGAHGVIVASSANTISGNFIGTDASGDGPLPNGECGIAVIEGASNNTISGNLIAFNRLAGVQIGGFGASISGNLITANRIRLNGGLGIDLNGDGVTANDHCDPDGGPNNLQNFPVLQSVVSGPRTTRIQGTLDSAPNATYMVELFASAVCDPSGHGQGERFLGSTAVTTDGSCSGILDSTLPVTVQPPDQITATATDSDGNTSEFSACISIPPTPTRFYTVTPCRVADTRGPVGAYGGPALSTGSDRNFVISGQCGVSPTARSVVFNFAITQPTSGGHVVVYPEGYALPGTSTVNYSAGQTRANNAIITLGPSGDVQAHVGQGTGTVHFIIDIFGYFE